MRSEPSPLKQLIEQMATLDAVPAQRAGPFCAKCVPAVGEVQRAKLIEASDRQLQVLGEAGGALSR